MEAEKSKRKPVVDMNAGLYSKRDSVLPERDNIIGKLCQSIMLFYFFVLPALLLLACFPALDIVYVICFPAFCTTWLLVIRTAHMFSRPFFPRLPFSRPCRHLDLVTSRTVFFQA